MPANPVADPGVGRRAARLAAAPFLGAAALYGALLLAGNSPPAQGAIRARAAAALQRHLPEARLDGEAGLDWRLRIRLGNLEIPAREPGGLSLRAERVAVTPRWLALLAGRAEAEAVRLEAVHLRLPGLGELPAFSAHLRPGPPALLTADLPGGGRAELRAEREGPAAADVRLELTGVVLRDERLASGPVGPVAVALRGKLGWDAAAGRAELTAGHLALGPGAAGELSVSLATRPEPRASASFRAERVEWSALVAALPEALRPVPAAPHLRGTLSFHLRASGPPARPAEWQLEASLDLAGLHADGPVALLHPFDWRAPESAGIERVVRIGPENPGYVPLDEVPRPVEGAVLLSEDAGFFVHHGFDFSEIREALAERADTGRVRGASTITQQLAKNLYLSGERTLARKTREALATVALEASLPKRRLLEIYLNVAEWGPGIFGIGEAAHHYFGKTPRELTAKEAAFLATILPSPVRYHAYYLKGALSETWEERVRALLVKMYAADLLSGAEFLAALDEKLAFARRPAPGSPTLVRREPEPPAGAPSRRPSGPRPPTRPR